jgi:uncharacterized protein (TIGR00369 family)
VSFIVEVAHGMSGLESLRALIAAGGRMPLGETLDITLIEAGDGWVTFTGLPGPNACNPLGTIHGGYAAAILDSACSCAVHSKLGPTQLCATLDLKVSYLRPITVRTGMLRADGKIQTVLSRAGFAQAELRDARDRLYATATSTLLVTARREPIAGRHSPEDGVLSDPDQLS